jgi:hypothetical protein
MIPFRRDGPGSCVMGCVGRAEQERGGNGRVHRVDEVDAGDDLREPGGGPSQIGGDDEIGKLGMTSDPRRGRRSWPVTRGPGR